MESSAAIRTAQPSSTGGTLVGLLGRGLDPERRPRVEHAPDSFSDVAHDLARSNPEFLSDDLRSVFERAKHAARATRPDFEPSYDPRLFDG